MIEFNLSQVKAGWANVNIRTGNEELNVTASCTPKDAVRDFVDAVASLQSSAYSHCCWFQEPGEMHWQFLRSKGTVVVEILRYDGVSFPGRHGSGGTTVFKAETEWLDFARQLLEAMRRVSGSLGTDGYKHEWGHTFPQEACDKLEHAIRGSDQDGC